MGCNKAAEKFNEITGRHMPPEPDPLVEILFASQPFQPPENYLRNADLMLEGQTYDEVRELAPETLPEEKPSIMEQLKAGQVMPPQLERGWNVKLKARRPK